MNTNVRPPQNRTLLAGGTYSEHAQVPFAAKCRHMLPDRRRAGWSPLPHPSRRPKHLQVMAAVEAPSRPSSGGSKRGDGHSALLQGLGQVGDVAPSHMPWLLRLAHIRYGIETGSPWDACKFTEYSCRIDTGFKRPIIVPLTHGISESETGRTCLNVHRNDVKHCCLTARMSVVTGLRWRVATPPTLCRTAHVGSSCGGCAFHTAPFFSQPGTASSFSLTQKILADLQC